MSRRLRRCARGANGGARLRAEAAPLPRPRAVERGGRHGGEDAESTSGAYESREAAPPRDGFRGGAAFVCVQGFLTEADGTPALPARSSWAAAQNCLR